MPSTFLKELLNEGLFEKVHSNTAILKEDSISASLKTVKLTNLERNSVLLKCDKIKVQFFFNKEGKGQNKRCDYLLLCNNNLYFIELKSHPDADERYKDECINKFKAVGCLLDYAESVIKEFYDKTNYFNNFKRRFILLYKGSSIQKTTTSLKPKIIQKNDKPENFLSLSVENEAVIDILKLG